METDREKLKEEEIRSGSDQKPKEDEFQKKQLFWSRVTGISSVLGFLCILALTFAALSFIPAASEILHNFEEVSAELKDMSTEITKVLRSLNDQGLSEIYGTLDNIQKIDIQRLNDSNDSLYRIINPLAELFK